MSYRLIFLLGAALLLFSPRSSSLNSYFRENKKVRLGDNLPLSDLGKAYLLGDKSLLPRKVIKLHQGLNLMHLMTPSGLHLASLLFIVSPVIKKSFIKCFFLLLLLVSLQITPGFDSFERMTVFALLRCQPWVPISSRVSFLLTFIFFILSGQYESNPLSFSLSFLFLGALLYSRHRLEMIFFITLVQSLISFSFQQPFYLFSILWGFLLSLVSVVLFPLMAIERIFPNDYISILWLWTLKFFYHLKGVSVYPPVLLLSLLYLNSRYPKLKKLSVILYFIFLIPSLNIHRSGTFISPPPKGYSSKKSPKKGLYIFSYDNGMICRSRMRTHHWSTHCSM